MNQKILIGPDGDKLDELAKSIFEFDVEKEHEKYKGYREEVPCLRCEDTYYLKIGCEPTPLCDACAHTTVYEFSEALIALINEVEKKEKNNGHEKEDAQASSAHDADVKKEISR